MSDATRDLRNKVRGKLQALLDARESTMIRFPGLLGRSNTTGSATVSGEPRYCHVRIGSDQGVQVKVFNVRTPHINGLSVIVGYDPAQPELFQVLSERGGIYTPEDDNPSSVIKHAAQHEWGNAYGFDIPYLEVRQLRGCRPSATVPASLLIEIDAGIYEIGGALYEWAGSAVEGNLDLTSSVPGTGMRWVLITMNATGVPVVTEGAATSFVDISDIPAAPDPNDWRIAAVWLQAGDTAITDWPNEQRIVDLRYVGSRSVSPDGGYISFGNCIVVAKSGGNFDVIQSGLAAATSETHVVILNGDWLEDISTVSNSVTVSGWMDQHFTDAFGVRLAGAGDVGPILTMSHDSLWSCVFINRVLAGGAGDYIGLDASDVLAYKHLSDLQIHIEGGVTGRDVYAAKLGAPAGHASTASRCLFVVADAGSGAAVECVGGDVTFDNMCELRNEDSGGLALIISGNGEYQFEHARIEGGVLVTGAATVRFRNCRIAGDVTINSGGAGATVYTRGVWIGGDISHGTNDKLITWQTNIDNGATVTGTGAVVPIGLLRDGGSHTDHFVGPVDAAQAAYMRLQPSGSVPSIHPAGLDVFWTDWLADPINYKAIEIVAARDGVNPDFGVLRTIAGGSELPAPILKLGVGVDASKYITLDGEGNIINPNSIIFRSPSDPEPPLEGSVYWNAAEVTLNIVTGLGPVLQVGQELYTIVYNDTGSQIDNGTAVYPVGAVGGNPSVAEADATTHATILGIILVTTMDIPNGTAGLVATILGKVRDVNTSGFNLGDTVWIAAGATGILNNITNVKPSFPNYAIQLGGIAVVDPLDGVIQLAIEGAPIDTIQNFWNGAFRESFDLLVTSDGAIVTGTLTPTNGHPDMTMMFSDGFTLLDTDPGATVALTPGTDEIPQTNYIYIPQSTKVLTVSTSAWPYTVEHIRVAQVLLQSASATQTEGALRNQNWNDHIEDTTTFQGHLPHIGAKLRQFEAQWDSGCEGSVVIAGGVVSIKSTSGLIYQMHLQTYPAQDMIQYTIDAVSQGSQTFTITGDGDLSSTFPDGKLISVHDSTGNDRLYTIASSLWSDPDFIITVEEAIPSAVADGSIGDDIHVVNDFTTAYREETDLASITLDASGNALNNTSFSVVVWGVSNKDGEPTHLMANMPLSTYSKNFPDQAVVDADAAAVYTIPKAFQGVGFLIARFTFVNSGGTWTLYETQDLRGFLPNTTAGSGAGGSGITTFTGLTDTPSAYTGEAGSIVRVAAGETAVEFLDAIQVDSVTKTVGSGGDYATIQEAIDWFKNKLVSGTCVIDVDAGTYDEAVAFEDLYLAKKSVIELRGDTRVLAGISYVDGAACNQAGLTNGGNGTVTLSNAGNNITVVMSVTNPDFDADGWVNGDKLLVYDNAGAITEATVDSVLDNVFTLSATAPSVGNDGTAIGLLPNRRIERTSAGPCVLIDITKGIKVDGWYLKTSTGADCDGLRLSNGAAATAENTIARAEDQGFNANSYWAYLDALDGACSAWECSGGYFVASVASINATDSTAVGCTTGYWVKTSGAIVAGNAVAVNCTTGYRSQLIASMSSTSATARQCTTGYYALRRGYIFATSTSGNNNGNGTNYNPAVSDVFGNNNASITWS